MPKTEGDLLGRDFARRLRAELDRLRPLYSSPRYMSPMRRPLRFAPVGLCAAVAGILALSGFVATGSPNPVVWTQRVVTVIEAPSSTGAPPPAAPSHSGERIDSRGGSEPRESPEAAESQEPAESPEPRESPEPADDHSGSGGGSDSSGTSGSGSGDH